LTTLREHCDARFSQLESDRVSWWQHWRELAEYILPRRYRWLISPNEQRGGWINGKIIDSTATIAARVLSAGMMAGITSPARPWFKLVIEGVDKDESHPVNIWLSECQKRMMRVMNESNFYNGMAQIFEDLSVFNTASMLIYEDFEDVIRCYNSCTGEYYLGNSDRMKVEVFYRKFTWTVSQIVERWGIENCSENVKTLYEQKGASLQQEIIIAHSIEPNKPYFDDISRSFAYRELYWEWGSAQTRGNNNGPQYLECRGFHELPGIFPRWDISGNDAYGRGPSMDALGDIKQLQQETKRKAQAIDKLVNPPLLADVQLKNQPASTLPGGVTYVAGLSKTTEGMKPIYEVRPPIQEIMMDIQEVQKRIKTIFFNDIFMMFENLQAEPRSAAAVDVRREEKLIMLGPVLERFQGEALDPAIDRVWNVMQRAGLFPPPPREVQGMPIQVNYISMLANAQQAANTLGIERVLQLAGGLVSVAPDAMDKIDIDQSIDEYSSFMNVPPKIIRSDDAVAEIRQTREKEKQQIQQLQMTDAAAKGAKTLSETDIGGGQNALQAMIGG
jgi:hypothetical protein